MPIQPPKHQTLNSSNVAGFEYFEHALVLAVWYKSSPDKPYLYDNVLLPRYERMVQLNESGSVGSYIARDVKPAHKFRVGTEADIVRLRREAETRTNVNDDRYDPAKIENIRAMFGTAHEIFRAVAAKLYEAEELLKGLPEHPDFGRNAWDSRGEVDRKTSAEYVRTALSDGLRATEQALSNAHTVLTSDTAAGNAVFFLDFSKRAQK